MSFCNHKPFSHDFLSVLAFWVNNECSPKLVKKIEMERKASKANPKCHFWFETNKQNINLADNGRISCVIKNVYQMKRILAEVFGLPGSNVKKIYVLGTGGL